MKHETTKQFLNHLTSATLMKIMRVLSSEIFSQPENETYNEKAIFWLCDETMKARGE